MRVSAPGISEMAARVAAESRSMRSRSSMMMLVSVVEEA